MDVITYPCSKLDHDIVLEWCWESTRVSEKQIGVQDTKYLNLKKWLTDLDRHYIAPTSEYDLT